MIQNKLVLYCARLEQAMLWEVCKHRRCATSNCLFKKVVKNFGENLWSETPMRIATITAAKDQLELLTKPIVIRRTPVMAQNPIQNHAIRTEGKGRKIVRTPVRTPITSLTDLLREEIINAAQHLK